MTDGFGNSRQHADRDNIVTLPTVFSSSVIRAAAAARRWAAVPRWHRLRAPSFGGKPPVIRRDGLEVAPLAPHTAFRRPGTTFQIPETPVKTRAARNLERDVLEIVLASPRMRTKPPMEPGMVLSLLLTFASFSPPRRRRLLATGANIGNLSPAVGFREPAS
jgi:hypothetical protein